MSFKDDVSISDLFFLHAVTPVLFEKTEEYNHILKNDACKIDVSWLGSFLATTLYFCKNQNRAEHEKLVNETLARNANFYKNNFSSVTDVKKLLLERNSYYLNFAFDKNNNFDLDGLLKHFLPIIVYDCKNNCLASVESCLFSTEDNDTENEKNIESEITGYFSSLVSELECVIDEYNHDYAEEKKADERDVLSTPTLNSTVAPSSAVPQYVSSYEFRNSETYRTRKVKPRTVYLICLAIIAIIALVILMTKLINNDSYEYTYISPTSQITTTVTQTATEKTILPEPENGKIFVGAQYSDDYDCSELTVRASDSESCLVKVKNPSGYTIVSFYVRAGNSVTVKVPREKLQTFFATGRDWYGYGEYFGEYTSYSKDSSVLDYKEYSWEYTLYPVTDGNFSETPIMEDEF